MVASSVSEQFPEDGRRHLHVTVPTVSSTALPSSGALVAAWTHYLLCNGGTLKTVCRSPQEVYRAQAKAYRALIVGVRGPGV